MAGFLFTLLTPPDSSAASPEMSKSHGVFAAAGVEELSVLRRDQFELRLYRKPLHARPSLVEFPDQSFIAVVGTLFYRRSMGAAALTNLYHDFLAGRPVLEHLLGHFAVFIYHGGKLTLFNDFNGLYQIFSAQGGRVLSSSFLAAAAATDRQTSDQGIYEYLIYGAFHGRGTIFRDVENLDSGFTYQVSPTLTTERRTVSFPAPWNNNASRDEVLSLVESQVTDYFRVYVENFGDRICSALSGGYDSRLMIATLRKLGVLPKIYVYGPDSHKDVKVARAICEGEKLPLDVIDKAKFRSPIPAERFPETFRQQFYALDSRSLLGAADDGVDHETRLRRFATSELHLNGAGGEIYRDYWQLPDQGYSTRAFVARTYWRSYIPYFLPCTSRFDQEEFFAVTGEKMEHAGGGGSGRLTRWQAEAVYPYYRLKYCMNLCYYPNNLLGSSLTPYIEPMLTQPSHHIPLSMKRHANFQMALLRRLDPSLAKYASQYGGTFAIDAPLRRRLKNWQVILNRHFVKGTLPISLLARLYRRKMIPEQRPYFLGEPFIRELCGSLDHVSQYIHPDQIWDASQYNRAVTLEYLLSRFPSDL